MSSIAALNQPFILRQLAQSKDSGQAVDAGEGVIQLGSLPLGIYAGQQVFRTPQEARLHLEYLRKEKSDWGVYQLSGDFEIDTYSQGDGRHFIRRTLLANRKHEFRELVGRTGTDLSVKQFDQTPNQGWRQLAGQGKFEAAARSIENYLRDHPDLNPFQIGNLHFHAGQMRAFARQYDLARNHFESSLHERDETKAPVKFDAYVRATIAFLEEDSQALDECLEKIAAGEPIDGEIPNLKIVRALRKSIGQPYSEVYGPFAGMPLSGAGQAGVSKEEKGN